MRVGCPGSTFCSLLRWRCGAVVVYETSARDIWRRTGPSAFLASSQSRDMAWWRGWGADGRRSGRGALGGHGSGRLAWSDGPTYLGMARGGQTKHYLQRMRGSGRRETARKSDSCTGKTGVWRWNERRRRRRQQQRGVSKGDRRVPRAAGKAVLFGVCCRQKWRPCARNFVVFPLSWHLLPEYARRIQSLAAHQASKHREPCPPCSLFLSRPPLLQSDMRLRSVASSTVYSFLVGCRAVPSVFDRDRKPAIHGQYSSRWGADDLWDSHGTDSLPSLANFAGRLCLLIT